jgi:Uma2 family endonuclease
MQLTALHPPKTLMEVYRMLPEGTRAELINNQLFMSPAPTLHHQNVIFNLTGQFYIYVNQEKNGKALVSPVDVYLDEENAVQPDIVFVMNENISILKDDGIYGAPDLIIEVLSPGTRKHDFDKKKKLYEKSGVKEYWIVDPVTKESPGFQLKNSKYVLFKEEKAKLTSALLNHSFIF